MNKFSKKKIAAYFTLLHALIVLHQGTCRIQNLKHRQITHNEDKQIVIVI